METHGPVRATGRGGGYWSTTHERSVQGARDSRMPTPTMTPPVTSAPEVKASASIGPWPSTAQHRAAYLETQTSRPASGVHDPLDVLDLMLVLRRLVQAEY
jgi:hypothetical protein